MATPLTAGAATVTRQYLTDKFGLANPSAALVKAVLLHTATDMFPGQYGQGTATQELMTKRPNSDEGYGRVNMAALAQLSNGRSMIIDNKTGVSEGQSVEVKVQVGGSKKLLANLVYTDAPASPNASVALVNDLDLSVEKPDGTRVSLNDHINNNEVIELNDLAAGTYKVIVTGTKVPSGKGGSQAYALVISLQN